MPHTREQVEARYRAGLAVRSSSPAVGREITTDSEIIAWLKGLGVAISAWERRPRVGKAAAARTPPELRDVLVAMARSAAMEDRRVA